MGLEKFEAVETADWEECRHVNAARYGPYGERNTMRQDVAMMLDPRIKRRGWETLLNDMHKRSSALRLLIDQPPSRVASILDGTVRSGF